MLAIDSMLVALVVVWMEVVLLFLLLLPISFFLLHFPRFLRLHLARLPSSSKPPLDLGLLPSVLHPYQFSPLTETSGRQLQS